MQFDGIKPFAFAKLFNLYTYKIISWHHWQSYYMPALQNAANMTPPPPSPPPPLSHTHYLWTDAMVVFWHQHSLIVVFRIENIIELAIINISNIKWDTGMLISRPETVPQAATFRGPFQQVSSLTTERNFFSFPKLLTEDKTVSQVRERSAGSATLEK